MMNIRTGTIVRPALIAPFLCLVYILSVMNAYGSPLAVVTLGTEFSPQHLHQETYSEEGYDGQFVYYLARYGLDAEPYLDVPAYRAQRILLSVFGWIGSLGQDSLLPWALLTVNLFALGTATWLLEELLIQRNRSKWIALGFALSLGMFGAARLSTTETLAYTLVLGGIMFMEKDRWVWAALAFALGVLSKETTLFFPAAYGAYLLYQRKIIPAVLFGSIVLIPFGMWQAILYTRFGILGIGSGGAGATGFEIIPFMGYIRLIWLPLTQGNAAAGLVLGLLMGVFVMLPILWALREIIADTRYTLSQQPESNLRGWSLSTWLLLANCAIMPFIPLSTFAEPLGILRFIVGLQISIILYAAERRKNRALLYSTFWAVTSLLVIVSDFAALP